MDDPVKQIEGVIRSLTQGSPNEQSSALNRYFVPNAEFQHPFCRVPPFSDVSLPLVGGVNSRQLVLAIFRWYRIISPRIDLKINSVQFDEAAQKMYIDISHRMALWFIPFYAAHVNLSYRQLANGDSHEHGLSKPIRNGDLPTFAEVAASKQPLSDETRADNDDEGEAQYYIAKQEDFYQVNEWIKFLVPFDIGTIIVSIMQLFATWACLAGTIAFFPLVWILTHGGDRGNVMPPVKRVADDGQVFWKGFGADWARRTFSPLNSIGCSAIQGVVVNVQDNAHTLAQKGERFASSVQQRGRKLIHDAQAQQEALVRAAQEKAGGLADEAQKRAEGFALDVQRTGAGYIDAAHEKTAGSIDAAQQKERKLVNCAQAREERLVADLQGTEDQAAENTRQWWAANKKC